MLSTNSNFKTGLMFLMRKAWDIKFYNGKFFKQIIVRFSMKYKRVELSEQEGFLNYYLQWTYPVWPKNGAFQILTTLEYI